MSLSNFKWFLIILLAAIELVTIGCIMTSPRPAPPPSSPTPLPLPGSPSKPETAVIPEAPKEPEERPGPRAMASLQMTEQGRELLERKKVDDAIRVLERAVSLNPGYGQNLLIPCRGVSPKRNTSVRPKNLTLWQGHYLEGNNWMLKVEEQKKRIKKSSLSPQ